MITLKNISFGYNKKLILNNFNLTIPQGITTLLGKSGSGKTTVLRLIAGLEIPQKGEVQINRETVSANGKIIVPPHKRNIGFIFQDLALWPDFTVKKHLEFVLKENKVGNVARKVADTLGFFKLNGLENRYPSELSGGQKQLLALARSIVLTPHILLMDEPLTGLDPDLKSMILDYLLKIKSELGTTIVYVTHDRNEAEKIADQIVQIGH